METSPEINLNIQPVSPEARRARRTRRLREQARLSVTHMLASLELARMAVTFAIMAEPNRELRQLKSVEAEGRLGRRLRRERVLLRAARA